MMQEPSSSSNITYTLHVIPGKGSPIPPEDPGHPVRCIDDLQLAFQKLSEEEETIVTLEASPSIHGVNAIQGISHLQNIGKGIFFNRKMEMGWLLAIVKDGPKGSFETWADTRINAPDSFDEVYQFFYDFIEHKKVVDPSAMGWEKL